MAVVVLLIVLAVIVFLLYQSVQDARRRAEGADTPAVEPTRPVRPTPPVARPRPAARTRPRKVKIDESALADHVAKLRDAVAGDLITLDEAVDSVLRQTDGALSPEVARKMLNGRGD